MPAPAWSRRCDALSSLVNRVQQACGSRALRVTRVGGGHICSAAAVALADGRRVFVKTHADPPPGFFAAEAAGLTWLGDVTGGARLPTVIAADSQILVLSWVEAAAPTGALAEQLGRELAGTHLAGPARFGSAELGYIGPLALPATHASRWPEFYVETRLRPFLRLALDRGTIDRDDVSAIERVCGRIDRIAGPPEPPARIHGDLWSGNVVWSAGGAYLVDAAAASGGHRETDLAMLALFGAPHLDRLLAAYDEAAPLAEGWRDRVALHQLHPLLVHAALFGGGYGQRAVSAAVSLR